MIYELVLGGNTIKVHYTPWKWKRRKVPGENRTAWTDVVKAGFGCTVGPSKAHPYHHTWEHRGFTLLNAVCRQLYKETATLPYKLNIFAFPDEYTLKRYTLIEKRLPLPQRRAMRKLYIRSGLPTKTLQDFLGGIEYVLVGIGSRVVMFRPSKTEKKLWIKVKEETFS